VSPARWGNAHPSIVPYQLFRGSDARYFVVGVGTQEQWLRLVKLLGVESLGADPRFENNPARIKNRDQLIPVLQQRFDAQSSEVWLKQLKASDIPAAAIQTVGEALNDPQTIARGLVVEIEHPTLKLARSIANPIRYAERPVVYRMPPPLLGQHSRQILRQLAYSEEDTETAMGEACRATAASSQFNSN